ncbi:MAG: amidohydrolase [Methanomassiliicoccales archaeon]|nr:amidohydrolase [Methanomassiliicoccales archaeon]
MKERENVKKKSAKKAEKSDVKKEKGIFLDTAIINANVITVDKNMSRAEAVGILNGLIVAVGSNEEIESMVGSKTKVIDAKGKTVLPGFHDSHMHPLLVGHFARGVQLTDVKDIPEMLERIKEKVKETPKGEMILGFGWNQERMAEKRYPTRWEVDTVAPDHPVFLIHWNAHIYLINTMLMKQKGITRDTPDPPGGTIVKDEKGEPTGVLLENAIDLIAPGFLETGAGLFSYEQSKVALKYCADKAAEWGLTSIVDILAGDAQVKAYQELEAEGNLPVRVNFYLGFQYLDHLIKLGIKSGFGSSKVRLAGAKMIVDGSLSSHTAALREPYTDMPDSKGVMRLTPEEIRAFVENATKNGIRVDIHALGDGAIETVLKIFKETLSKYKVKDPRFKISHCIIHGPDLIEQFKEMNVIANVQPVFIMKGQHWIPRLVGPQREKYAHPYRSMMEAGIHMCSGTDAPIETMNPLMNVYAAAVRKDAQGIPEGGWHPEQCVPVEHALKMVTIEGAYATGEEHVKGSIEVGKYADLVILTDDPLAVKPDKIKDIRVLLTMVGGKVVHSKME